MLLNKVAVGRGYKMTTADTTMTEPPPGYDSVSIGTRWLFGGDTDNGLAGISGSRFWLKL